MPIDALYLFAHLSYRIIVSILIRIKAISDTQIKRILKQTIKKLKKKK